MGIYLSNPKTEKTIDRGECSSNKWVALGMQGIFYICKDGELKWRIVILLKQIYQMMFQFLEYLMAMEDLRLPYLLKKILFLLY